MSGGKQNKAVRSHRQSSTQNCQIFMTFKSLPIKGTTTPHTGSSLMPVFLSATVYVWPSEKTCRIGIELITQSLEKWKIKETSSRLQHKYKENLQSEKQSHSPLDHFPSSSLLGTSSYPDMWEVKRRLTISEVNFFSAPARCRTGPRTLSHCPSADDYDILDILVNLILNHKASHLGLTRKPVAAGIDWIPGPAA